MPGDGEGALGRPGSASGHPSGTTPPARAPPTPNGDAPHASPAGRPIAPRPLAQTHLRNILEPPCALVRACAGHKTMTGDDMRRKITGAAAAFAALGIATGVAF